MPIELGFAIIILGLIASPVYLLIVDEIDERKARLAKEKRRRKKKLKLQS